MEEQGVPAFEISFRSFYIKFKPSGGAWPGLPASEELVERRESLSEAVASRHFQPEVGVPGSNQKKIILGKGNNDIAHLGLVRSDISGATNGVSDGGGRKHGEKEGLVGIRIVDGELEVLGTSYQLRVVELKSNGVEF